MYTIVNAEKLFQLWRIGEKLLECRDTIFGLAIKESVMQGKIEAAVKMIQEQRALGHEKSIEWCVGASTLQLIDKYML